MKIIDKLISAIILLFVLLSVLTSCSTKKEALPNIVFIMADDLGYGDVSRYNPESKIQTPNIDILYSEGVHFTDAHSPSAVCTPTRYGLLTGRYGWRTRLKRNVLNGFSRPLIEKDRITVAHVLKNTGYTTACIGKWHLGVGWQTKTNRVYENEVPANEVDFSKTLTDSPNDHGFDYSFITSACSTVDPPYVFIENGKCTALPTEKMENNAPVVTFGSRPGPMVPNWSNENVDPTFVQKSEAFIDRTLKSDKKKSILM